MINDNEYLSFGELREAFHALLPDCTGKDIDGMMLIIWSAVFARRLRNADIVL